MSPPSALKSLANIRGDENNDYRMIEKNYYHMTREGNILFAKPHLISCNKRDSKDFSIATANKSYRI